MSRTKGRLSGPTRALVHGAAAALVALTGVIAAGVPALVARAAEAVTFTVNSTALIVENASCGDAGGVCTLRRALEEANSVPSGTDVFINVAAGVEGAIPFPTSSSQLMATGTTAGLDLSGAVFAVNRPMTIDLGGVIHLVPGDGSAPIGTTHLTGIWVNSADVHLKNFSDWYSTATAILFSGQAHGSSLDGGVSIQSENDHTNRQVAIWAPASNVTISNYTMGRQPNEAYDGGIVLDAASGAGRLSNITISNVTFDNAAESTACSNTDARGCSGRGVNVEGGVGVDNLVVADCLFVNFTGKGQPIDANGAGDQSNWDIRNNTFKDVRLSDSVDLSGESYVTVQLPKDQSFSGQNHIRDNVFDNSSEDSRGGQALAIYMNGSRSSGSTTASTLFIEDNEFDGYLSPVRLYQAGTVTVRRNTFGAHSGSQANTQDEETSGGYKQRLFNNWDNSANRAIQTWYPTAATVANCGLSVSVAPPTSGQAPRTPVTLDVYWTASTKAERYLGSVDNISEATTITLEQLPPEAGYIRVQTQGQGVSADSQPESSQYSRVVAVATAPSTCQPVIDIDLRAWVEVPATATTHDQIVAPDSGAKELPDAAAVQSGEPVWFTYTVQNIGQVVLFDVVVRDARQEAPVCEIDRLAVGEKAGCVRQDQA
ncbi:MAG: hypothetical protein LBD77_10160 [Bifidobacteriaceae bacterium]|jgi:hypothetical protein|nr:hypothetical protein [Bifidobacteriaceae bacterium]